MTIEKNIKQSHRLWILIFYIIGLLGTSKIALHGWLPPTAEKGIWFYSALAAILLGDLIVTPYFVKPADAISYAVASIVALFAANAWLSPAFSAFDRFIWCLAVAYVVFVLIVSILAITLKDSNSLIGSRLSRLFFDSSAYMGKPKNIFTVVFLFALLAYHRHESREYIPISIAWFVFVVFKPLESLLLFARRFLEQWRTKDVFTRLGQVVGHETPNIVLVKEGMGKRAKFGDIIVARSDFGEPGLAITLDRVGFADGRWLRAIHLLNNAIPHIDNKFDNEVYITDPTALAPEALDLVGKVKDKLIGIVSQDTIVGRLNFEIVRNDLPIRLGSLVETAISNKTVLYQVIYGLTQEEIIQKKNTRGFVRAKAKKIGTWNTQNGNFETVPWLPQPNEPVFLAEHEEVQVDRNAIGHFPGTHYPVKLNMDTLVTHNAAILGILGVGKSFFALELVERLISENIKIICLDLTNQYAEELANYYDEDFHREMFEKLKIIGADGADEIEQNVEEGGSIQKFSSEIEKYIKCYLESTGKLMIINPSIFEVWRQDSKPFKNTASMATLTPCGITRIITEATLKVLQDQGMTHKARCCLIYEEAHSLIPEWGAVANEGDKSAVNGTAKAILQGRKFGLGCIVITQRTANVTKSVLNQCNTVFAMRIFDATGMEFLSNYIGDDYTDMLPILEDRQAIVFGRASSCRDPVLVRLNDRDKFIGAFRIRNKSEEKRTT